VLVLCARLGMGRVGTVAVDGTKIAASASKDANRTEEGLRKLAAELAARHAATDAQEDALFGDGRGDDDPGGPGTRRERVAAALASLEAEREAREAAERAAAQEHLDAAQAGALPPPGRPPAGAGTATARAALERETAACQARIGDWERRKAAGQRVRRRPVPPEQPALVRRARQRLDRALARDAARRAKEERKAPAVRNVTDPGSRLMPVRGGGFIQGYNAQNVASSDGLIIATRLTSDTTDARWYEPMISDALAAAAAMAAAGTGGGAVGLVLADAGYLSEANLTCDGPDRLIAVGKRRDLEKRARDTGGGQHGGPTPGEAIAAMTARLAAPGGITACRQRGRIAETPHGRIKHNMRLRQLSVRGIGKASGEWTFACAVHNIMMAITSGHLTTRALASLPG
jgi:hypothetical protein